MPLASAANQTTRADRVAPDTGRIEVASWDVRAAAPLYRAVRRAGEDPKKGATMAATTNDRDALPEGGTPLDPSLIMQVGSGFWPSKTLLSAVELGLFTALGSDALTGQEIAKHHDLRSRAVYDFLDGLVALRLLDRDGRGEDARYRNTPETAFFLDATSPAYIGGILEMFNARLYGFWGGLTEALRTASPQNELRPTG